MTGFVRAPRDFLAGTFFVLIGGAALAIGAHYRLGTLLSMGPGYFPRIIGVILVALGAAIMLSSLRVQGPSLEAWRLRPLILVLGSIVGFGWALERFGLMVSVAALSIIAAYAEPGRRHLEAVLLALFLTGLAWLIFVKGLGMPLMVWPEGVGS